MTNAKKIIHIGTIISLVLFFSGSFLLTVHVHAAADPTQTGGVSEPTTGGTNSGPPGILKNPLTSQTIPEFLLKIIDVILVFATPLIILYIMYAGYLFVTAAGSDEKVTTAKNALLWSVVGGVIVIGARVIIAVIQGTVAGL